MAEGEWISPIGDDAHVGAARRREESVEYRDAERLHLIRERLHSARRDRLPEYPPETLRQLLDDARWLSQLLRREGWE